jgi:hypothetical protein
MFRKQITREGGGGDMGGSYVDLVVGQRDRLALELLKAATTVR